MGEMISGIEENALKYTLDIIWHQINLRKLTLEVEMVEFTTTAQAKTLSEKTAK